MRWCRYAGWMTTNYRFQVDNAAAAKFWGDSGRPQPPPLEAPPEAPPEWPLPPLPMPLECRQNNELPEVAELQAPVARRLRGICDELDDAIRAINWQQNVRFQREISEAVANLREWVARSATAVAGEC